MERNQVCSGVARRLTCFDTSAARMSTALALVIGCAAAGLLLSSTELRPQNTLNDAAVAGNVVAW